MIPPVPLLVIEIVPPCPDETALAEIVELVPCVVEVPTPKVVPLLVEITMLPPLPLTRALALNAPVNPAVPAALTLMLPPLPPIAPTALALKAAATLTVELLEVRLYVGPAPLVGAAVKLAPGVTVNAPPAMRLIVPPFPDVDPPMALAMSVVAVPAVTAPVVVCT